MSWRTTFIFVLVATLITVLVGLLTSIGILPISQVIHYNDAGLRFIRAWIRLAIAIGIILPGIAFVVWFKYPKLRKIFGFYFLVLIIQIQTENIITSVRLQSLVVVIGLVFSTFRVWQLKKGQQFIKSIYSQRANFKWINSVFWLLLLFWLGNLIVILTLSLPSIL